MSDSDTNQLDEEKSNKVIELSTSNSSAVQANSDSESSDDEENEQSNGLENNDEDLSEDYDETKTSPYHLLGCFSFCAALVISVTCILVSTLLLASHGASNEEMKFIWGTLFGAFIFFLFMCLCCTYYLGASKESWEIPAFSGIRKNFSNFVALAGLVVEFVQICSFSFNRTRKFAGVDVGDINYIAVPVGNGAEGYFTEIYWLMFIVSFIPYLFVIAIRIIIYVYTIKKGESSAASIVEKYQEKIHSVLWFLVNALYFPVIGTMLAGTDCTYKPEEITLDAENTILCLEGQHIAILICSMLALIVYYPAASFAQAQTQSISDIKFKPRIVFIMLQGKFAIALIAIFFTNTYYIYYSGLLFINLIFLVLNIIGQPCLVRWVNIMRTIFFSMSTWATFCAGVVGTWIFKDDQSSKTPLILLLIGWAIQIIGLTLFFQFWSKYKVTQEDNKSKKTVFIA